MSRSARTAAAVLAVPGRGGRFSLPIDDRLRIVARGQFPARSIRDRVENPLRPKEIQDRIRAGETAEVLTPRACPSSGFAASGPGAG